MIHVLDHTVIYNALETQSQMHNHYIQCEQIATTNIWVNFVLV